MAPTLRRLVYVALAALAVLAGTGQPAGAHAGAVLTIHSDGAGSIWITARWTDGHPVNGPVSAIVTATTTTGNRIGPAPLRATDEGTGTLTYSGQLAPGRWAVTAELASPAVARCDAQVDVRLPATPAAVTCTPAVAEPAAAPSGGGPAARWPMIILIGGAAGLLLLAARPAVRQTRRTRTLPDRRRGRTSRETHFRSPPR